MGGIEETGLENLKNFVMSGGKLICFDAACDLVIESFKLPIRDVLQNLKRNEFYSPGSIVRLEIDKTSPIARGVSSQLPAYFINSAAYEVDDMQRVKIIARYAENNALLSGWMLGEKYLNGKAALLEVSHGKGKIILFAFRPQHRGQTFATFPLLFNSLEKE
jgi:hypothetical protein